MGAVAVGAMLLLPSCVSMNLSLGYKDLSVGVGWHPLPAPDVPAKAESPIVLQPSGK